MISITSKSPYAVLALAELRAQRRARSPCRSASSRAGATCRCSSSSSCSRSLRRAGIISSQRGVKGGYRFAREPSERDGARDRRAARRPARAATPRACSPMPPQAARTVLEQTTIADVIEREAREAGASMYYI